MKTATLAAVLTGAMCLPALAQTPADTSIPSATLADGTHIRAADRARLDGLDGARADALAQIAAEGEAEYKRAAADVLDAAALPADQISADELAGAWQCRTTKLGGLLPAVAYPNFRCFIGADEGIFKIDKLTGSQRLSGTVHRDGDRWVFLGTVYVADDQPVPYASFPEEMDTNVTETLPSVGVLERIGPNRLRLLLPSPYRESRLDVLTLTR